VELFQKFWAKLWRLQQMHGGQPLLLESELLAAKAAAWAADLGSQTQSMPLLTCMPLFLQNASQN
jgi:hypothetical protein